MAGGKKRKHCLCSICKNGTHEVNGVRKPGKLQDLRTWKQHNRDDVLREAEQEYEGNAEVSEARAVLLASFGRSVGRPESIPVRPRDRDSHEDDITLSVEAEDVPMVCRLLHSSCQLPAPCRLTA